MGDENTKLLILWIIYFLYMITGAIVFMELEYENEQNNIVSLKQSFSRIKKLNVSVVALEELKAFCPLDSPLTPNRWDLAGSFYFVGTVLTTVGFGLTSPATKGGQIFFLFYAMLGIPLHVLLFNTLLEQMVLLIAYLLRKAYRYWKSLKRNRTAGNPTNWEPSTPLIALMAVVMAIVIVLISAPLFVFLEKWTFFESVYFAVVTYTTVGFGDFVPSAFHTGKGENMSIHYKIGNWMVIILGILFMYPAMAVMASVYKQILGKLISKCRHLWKRRKARNRTADVAEPQEASRANSTISIQDDLTQERQKTFAKLVIKNWKNHNKASTMGTLNAVEDCILKSRLSPREVNVAQADDHVDNHVGLRRTPWSTGQLAVNHHQLSGHVTSRANGHVCHRFHVPNHVNSLEELQAMEHKLNEEFKDAMNKLQRQRLRLLENTQLTGSRQAGTADNVNDSGVSINLLSIAGSQVGLVTSSSPSHLSNAQMYEHESEHESL